MDIEFKDSNSVELTLNNAPKNRLLLPAQLGKGIKLKLSGARLYKGEVDKANIQTQMTAAIEVPLNRDEEPEWWIEGLNWNAMPFLKHIAEGLENNYSVMLGNNPKSAAFSLHGRNVILKTPIKQLLGTPNQEVNEQKRKNWIGGMANILNVKLDKEVGKEGIVKASLSKKTHFHLQQTRFTWEKYLSELLKGEDLVTKWASTAFGGDEDIGLGQIEDKTLGKDYTIKEYREFKTEIGLNYLEYARKWATSGRVPKSLDPNDSDDFDLKKYLSQMSPGETKRLTFNDLIKAGYKPWDLVESFKVGTANFKLESGEQYKVVNVDVKKEIITIHRPEQLKAEI